MKLHTLKGYIQAIYLVEYDHGLLLLDGCCRADVDDVCHFIETELKRPVSDLKLVTVTHMHPDHAGGAHALRKRTGCSIATGAAKKPWYRGIDGRVMHLTDVVLALWVAKRIGKKRKNLWYNPVLKPDVVLKEGETLPGFEDWRVIETHGHTDRDISLHHEPSNKIYVADLIVKVREKFLTPFPIFHPNRYRQSVAKIQGMNPSAIWLAHGGEIETHPSHACFDVHTPTLPRTHWRATKYRIKRLMQRA